MENKYKYTKTTVSLINYHFVFCPRYRRKIFLIDGVERRLKELVKEICQKNGFEILAMECDVDHVHLFINVPPKYSPADVMHLIKGGTGKILMSEFKQFSKMPNFWTRSYFVSTAGAVSSEIIKQYINNQRTK